MIRRERLSLFADGSLSDTALGTQHNMGGSRRVKMAGGTTGKMATSMGKKSSSTSQLSATGERNGGNATARRPPLKHYS